MRKGILILSSLIASRLYVDSLKRETVLKVKIADIVMKAKITIQSIKHRFANITKSIQLVNSEKNVPLLMVKKN